MLEMSDEKLNQLRIRRRALIEETKALNASHPTGEDAERVLELSAELNMVQDELLHSLRAEEWNSEDAA